MEENKISAEEIISKHAGFKINANTRGGCLTFEDCFAAMEEYAAQFKQQSAAVWVKASDVVNTINEDEVFAKFKDYKLVIYHKGSCWRSSEDESVFMADTDKELNNVLIYDESQQSQEELLPKEPEVVLMGEQSSLTDEDIESMADEIYGSLRMEHIIGVFTYSEVLQHTINGFIRGAKLIRDKAALTK